MHILSSNYFNRLTLKYTRLMIKIDKNNYFVFYKYINLERLDFTILPTSYSHI